MRGSTGSGIWHVLVPGLLFIGLAALFATTTLDIEISRAWAFDSSAQRFVGSGPGEWWAKDLLHSFAGLLLRLLGATIGFGFALSWVFPPLRAWRRPLAYLLVASCLAVGSVGLVKEVSNIDCPWSLDAFNGNRPYVHLFGDRPDDLPRARCFPGAHSSSGFALFSLYFLFARRRPRTARVALALAVVVGSLFALGQEARGAHFLSHDLWSAAMAWFSCLAVYRFAFNGNVWHHQPWTDGSELPEDTHIGYKPRPVIEVLGDAG